ncbi:MAG: protease modulator HflC [Myxococcota bacterium]|nr:protease modulator HflC [Myxococcota bacterium]
MKAGQGIALAVTFVLFFLAGSALYTVSEVSQVVVTRFGAPVGKANVDPGLKFKLPFVDEVHRFDKRYLAWDGDANQMVTSDKKYIWVDTFARWRIADALLFFQKVRNESGAQTRLDDIIDGATRTVIASQPLIEVVRTSSQSIGLAQGKQEEGEVIEMTNSDGSKSDQAEESTVLVGRSRIQDRILDIAKEACQDMGIELVDVRIKRINYVKSVQVKVFERMISERKRIAAQYRSEGQGEAARIRGKMERELKQIESEAYRKGQEIRGQADAEATRIYADAYKKDPGFYEFLKTLDTYRMSFDGDTRIILDGSGNFSRYINQP